MKIYLTVKRDIYRKNIVTPGILNLLAGILFFAGYINANAVTYSLAGPSQQIIGKIQYAFTSKEDTLLDIARKYDLGFNEITAANPDVDPWLPGNGTRILLPTRYILPDGSREGIVVNLAEMRLYYYPKSNNGGENKVITHPIGIGREGWETPEGIYRVVLKMKNPSWTMPPSVYQEAVENGNKPNRLVPPGPANPLGKYAIKLSADGLFIHGTNMPFSIGMRVSRGCLRLYPEDIHSLVRTVPKGTLVRIVEQSYKLGYENDVLYLESHQPVGFNQKLTGMNLTPVVSALVRSGVTNIDDGYWSKIIGTAMKFTGVPEAVYRPDSVWQKNMSALALPNPFPGH